MVNQSWDPVWENVFKVSKWRGYPSENLVRFMARNFYSKNRGEIKVLDVGCGSGANLWYLSREGFKAYGIDGSKTAIELAEKKLSFDNLKAELHVGDVLDLNVFPDGYFDVVIDLESLCTNKMEATRKILSEIYRVLNNSGLFYSEAFSEFHTVLHTDKGYIRKINKKDLCDLYDKFKIKNIDLSEYTIDNGIKKVSEYIVVAEK